MALSKFGRMVATCACVMALAAASEANAGTITTTFAGDNNFDGNFFDVTTGPQNLVVTGMTVNVDSGPLTIDVYTRAGGYAGFETDSGAWALSAQDAITGLGEDIQTPISFTPFDLAAGSQTGFYVTIDTNTDSPPFMYYTDGSNTYSNADLSISAGEGSGGLFGSEGIFSPRTWNGSVSYTTGAAVPEPSSLPMLLAGLGLLGGAFYFGRKKAKAS